jgi:hypothetical protein
VNQHDPARYGSTQRYATQPPPNLPHPTGYHGYDARHEPTGRPEPYGWTSGGYPPPPVRPAPKNGLGTAGFVLGLLGLLFSFIPLIGIIAWPLVILGLILSGVGLVRARSGRATNTGLAVAGLTCSALGLIVCILYAAAFGAAVSSAEGGPGTAASTSGDPTGPDAATAGIGEEVRDGSFAFTVTAVESAGTTLGDEFLQSNAQGTFILVRVTVTNIGDESQLFTDGYQKLVDEQGRTFDADTGAAALSLPGSDSFLNAVNPGNSVDGTLVFDVPEGLVPVAIELHDSPFSGGVTVDLTR